MKTYHASPVEPFGNYGVMIAGNGDKCVVCFTADAAKDEYKKLIADGGYLEFVESEPKWRNPVFTEFWNSLHPDVVSREPWR